MFYGEFAVWVVLLSGFPDLGVLPLVIFTMNYLLVSLKRASFPSSFFSFGISFQESLWFWLNCRNYLFLYHLFSFYKLNFF